MIFKLPPNGTSILTPDPVTGAPVLFQFLLLLLTELLQSPAGRRLVCDELSVRYLPRQ